jgi:predicted SAM-dependent methyltransferase
MAEALNTSFNKDAKLELGVGERPTQGYHHQDIVNKSTIDLDFICAPWEVAIKNNLLSEVLAIGVIEHLRFQEVEKTVANIHRMLAPGGVFIFDVPDMKIWSQYLYRVTHGLAHENPCTAEHVWRTIYGWQRWPGDEHKSGWTREDILALLKKGGFRRIYEGLDILLEKGIERRRFYRSWDAHIYLCATK